MILHRRVATTQIGNHNKPRKSFINHWPGVEITYHASATVKRFTNFLERKQFLRLFMAVTNYRIFTIMSDTFDIKTSDTRSCSTQIEPRQRLSQKIGQTMFELVRKLQNIDVFKKNLIRAATDLVESRLFRRQRTAFSEGKTGHF